MRKIVAHIVSRTLWHAIFYALGASTYSRPQPAMNDDDLSNELLELAGQTAGLSSKKNNPATDTPTAGTARKRVRLEDDVNDGFDDDDDDDDDDETQPVDITSNARRVTRQTATATSRAGVESEDDENDEEFKNPYPFEGKYESEEDRLR